MQVSPPIPALLEVRQADSRSQQAVIHDISSGWLAAISIIDTFADLGLDALNMEGLARGSAGPAAYPQEQERVYLRDHSQGQPCNYHSRDWPEEQAAGHYEHRHRDWEPRPS
jgi:hypothetical protein